MQASVVVVTYIRREDTVLIDIPEEVKAEYIEEQKMGQQRAEDIVTDYVLTNEYQTALDKSVHRNDPDKEDSEILRVALVTEA